MGDLCHTVAPNGGFQVHQFHGCHSHLPRCNDNKNVPIRPEKNGYNSVSGGFGVKEFNGVMKTCPQSTPTATVMKIWL